MSSARVFGQSRQGLLGRQGGTVPTRMNEGPWGQTNEDGVAATSHAFYRACQTSPTEAVQMLRNALGNPELVGLVDSSRVDQASVGRSSPTSADELLFASLPALSDADFAVAFQALTLTWTKRNGQQRLNLARTIIARPAIRSDLTDAFAPFIRLAVMDDLGTQPQQINLMSCWASELAALEPGNETRSESIDFVAALKKAGVTPTIKTRMSIADSNHTCVLDAFHAVFGAAYVVDSVDRVGDNLLHHAGRRFRCATVVKRLCDVGCDPHHKNALNQTPMDLAVTINSPEAIGTLLSEVRYAENELTAWRERAKNSEVRALFESQLARMAMDQLMASLKPSPQSRPN